MPRQCSSCGGFCKKSGCERENAPPPQREWVGLTAEERNEIIEMCYYEDLDFFSGDAALALTEAKLKEKNGY